MQNVTLENEFSLNVWWQSNEAMQRSALSIIRASESAIFMWTGRRIYCYDNLQKF